MAAGPTHGSTRFRSATDPRRGGSGRQRAPARSHYEPVRSLRCLALPGSRSHGRGGRFNDTRRNLYRQRSEQKGAPARMNRQPFNYAVVRQLIFKDWYLNRALILGSLPVGLGALALVLTGKPITFMLCIILLCMVIVGVGASLAMVTTINE